METTKKSSRTTKELILAAAFSFFEKPYTKNFSLSELAAKVGITKSAIYRHFKNKDMVIEAMRNMFLDIFAERLLDIQENIDDGKLRVPFANVIKLFADNPQYINYYIQSSSSDTDFEQKIVDGLLVRGVRKDRRIMTSLYSFKTGRKDITRAIFCGSTILFFIKARIKVSELHGKIGDTKEFASKLVDFLLGGLKNSTAPGNLIYPNDISKVRKQELESLCLIRNDYLPAEDKILNAFVSVIRKNGLYGVTVEKIADELNMAKSSLYFYFENKSQMMKTLIFKELQLLNTIITENISEAKNYSEYIYIVLKTELNFFCLRPSILPIAGWLLQSSVDDPMEGECEITNVWEKRIGEFLDSPNLGFQLKPEIFTLWIGMLPVALTMISKKKNLSEKELEESLEDFFEYVQFGVGNDCTSTQNDRI